MNRTDRLYAIVHELRLAAPRGRTTNWLAERFEVSARTIKRDMAALHEADVGLLGEEGRGGGYSLDRSRMLPPMAFTVAEAVAVAVAIGASDDLPFRTDARAALTKILDGMSPSQRSCAESVAGRVWVRSGEVRGRWAPVIDEALRTRRVVNLTYRSESGAQTERAIEPMALARTRANWHVLAWCRLRQAGRWFRMDRIERAVLTREVPPERELSETFGGPPPDDARPITLRG